MGIGVIPPVADGMPVLMEVLPLWDVAPPFGGAPPVIIITPYATAHMPPVWAGVPVLTDVVPPLVIGTP